MLVYLRYKELPDQAPDFMNINYMVSVIQK